MSTGLAQPTRYGPVHINVPMKLDVVLPKCAVRVVAHLEGPDGSACAVVARLDTVQSNRVIVQTPVPVGRGVLTLTYWPTED